MELVGFIIVAILVCFALLIAIVMLGGTWLGTKIFPEPETAKESPLARATNERTPEAPTPTS